MKRQLYLLLITTIFLISCSNKSVKQFNQISSSHSKVTFNNTLDSSKELNILTYLYYYNGAGVAAADFDNDGLEDLYFTANEKEDALYLNKGNFTFTNSTILSGIHNNTGWTTGVTTVDINNDGFLDLYICKVSGYKDLKGHNLLYINQGLVNGVPQFKEQSKEYGLDFTGFSTQSAFFDYDLDGDLDMYLLNHSIHPNLNYGNGKQRLIPNELSGDRLYENIDGKFIDVSSSTGIYQSKIGYGLGLSISDINNDGYPDIYVGNDFFENDYLYINNGNKTFTEIISKDFKNLGHTTHYSMGNAIADYNNDGNTDIFSLDMLPENLETYKASGTEYGYPIYNNYLKNNYSPQFMQNTLHLNLGEDSFAEISSLANIPATEWSWGILLADFDNDAHKDIFITNGIKGASNDMDFINFIANDNIQKNLNNGLDEKELKFIERMPEKHVKNYFFKNNGDLTFKNTTSEWSNLNNSFSNGCVYADLDNDGDLDLVTNNVNQEATILENRNNTLNSNSYLKLNFKGPNKNNFGIGAKVLIYTGEQTQVYENYTTKGYLSSVSPSLTIGIGNTTQIDSLKVLWPSGFEQSVTNLTINTTINLDIKLARKTTQSTIDQVNFKKVNSPTTFKHRDGESTEFFRDPLIPYANTNEGPTISIADVNLDGYQDIFIGGAKQQSSELFTQDENGKFTLQQKELFELDKTAEDVSQLFFNANGDEYLDLIVVSAGNEFKTGKNLNPRLYINNNGVFEKDTLQFKNIFINASKIKAWDIDNDKNLDIIISSDCIPQEFGVTPKQYIFKNDGKANFSNITEQFAPDLLTLGNVKDIGIVDLDNNGFDDLVLVGHWMPISIFMNNGTALTPLKQTHLEESNGLWNAIQMEDLDNDGDQDIIAGNWGGNSKLMASFEKPLTLYKADIDENDSKETIITYFHKDTETVFASKDELTKQVPSLNKKFLSYSDFSKATLHELFPRNKLNTGLQKKVYELRSCYFENIGNGKFKKLPLPTIAQISSVKDILINEINSQKEIVLVGNNYEISTQLGRLDASHGLTLYPSKDKPFTQASYSHLGVSGAARSIKKIKIKDKQGYLISRNNDSIVFIKKHF